MLREFLGYLRGESRESRTSESSQGDDVPDIEDDQPRNPYDEIQILSGHSNLVHLLTRVGEDRVLTAGHDNAVFIWSCKSGQILFSLEGHQKPVLFAKIVKFHVKQRTFLSEDEHEDDGVSAVITVSSDKMMIVWSLEDGSQLKTITEHGSVIKVICEIKVDGLKYCTGGQDICLWDSNLNLYTSYNEKKLDYIQRLVPLKDNKIIISTDKPYLVVYEICRSERDDLKYEISRYKKITGHRESVTSLVALSDAMFASASLDGTIIVWTSGFFQPTRIFNHHDQYLNEKTHLYTYSVRYVFALEQRYIFATIASGFAVFDPITDRCLVKHVSAHHAEINNMAVVNDGYLLATCSTDGTVRLWGSPSPTVPRDILDRKEAMLPLERLIGRRIKDLKDTPVMLELIGECAGHSGSVQYILECGSEGFVTSDTDGLLILWKDGTLLRDKRDQMVKQIVCEIGLFDH